MKSLRCPACNFLNWTHEKECKRCKADLPDDETAEIKSETEQDEVFSSNKNTEIGFAPRVAAGCWFALAACVPVCFFFYIFDKTYLQAGQGEWATFWQFGGMPVLSAAFSGFLWGAKILDWQASESVSQAFGRGVLVALAAFVIFLFVTVFVGGSFIAEDFVSYLFGALIGFFVVLFLGFLFVGWLAAIVGGLAGALFYLIFGNSNLIFNLIDSNRVSKTTVKLWRDIGIVLLILSLMPLAAMEKFEQEKRLLMEQSEKPEIIFER